MSVTRRIHRRLFIEELEPRIAPSAIFVTNKSPYKFLDADGDMILVSITGAATAGLYLTGGTEGDIINVEFAGTTGTSVLTIKDIDSTGGNTVVGGIIGTNGSLGGLALMPSSNGVVTGTTLTLGGALGKLTIGGNMGPRNAYSAPEFHVGGSFGTGTFSGHITHSTLIIGGGAKSLSFTKDLLDTTRILIAGSAGSIKISGTMSESFLSVEGNVASFALSKALTGSTLALGNSASTVNTATITGLTSNSQITIGNALGTLTLTGGLVNGSTVTVSGTAGTINIGNSMSASQLTASKAVNSFIISKDMLAGSSVLLGGPIRTAKFHGQIWDSGITFGGNVGTFTASKSITGGAPISFRGTAGTVTVTGTLGAPVHFPGTLDFGGKFTAGAMDTAGAIYLGGNVTPQAIITIKGEMTGLIQTAHTETGGDLMGKITIGSVGTSGHIDIGGAVTSSGSITISNYLGGALDVNEDLAGRIAVKGDVLYTGSILIQGEGITGKGAISVGRHMAGVLNVQGSMSSASSITIAGNVNGLQNYSILIGGNMGGTIKIGGAQTASRPGQNQIFIGGNMTGTISARQFGDTFIVGDWAGVFKASLAGAGNTLTYATTTGNAKCTPTNGFASFTQGVITRYTLSPAHPTENFIDMDGDVVDMTYGGAAGSSVDVIVMGDGTRGNIKTVLYVNSDQNSELIIRADGSGNGWTSVGQVNAAGQTLGSLKVQGKIESLSARTVEGDIVTSLGVKGALFVTGDFNGCFSVTGGDMTGSLNVIGRLGGRVNVSGDLIGSLVGWGDITSHIAIGGDLRGQVWAAYSITGGDITVGGALTGLIGTNAQDIGSTIQILGTGGIGETGKIIAARSLLGNIIVTQGSLHGLIRASQDLSGQIQIGGDLAGSGFIDIGSDITSTGTIEISGSVLEKTSQGWNLLAPMVSHAFQPTSLCAGDFNDDGCTDLVTVSEFSGFYQVLLGTGAGRFTPSGTLGAGIKPSSVVAADVNGDNKLDLLMTCAGTTGGVSIFLGNGDGSFATPVRYSFGKDSRSVVVGDFNGDTRPDLAVANYSSNDVSILLGNGNGTFGSVRSIALGSNAGPWALATADFNGDGALDLAVANALSNNVAILLGNGSGGFGTAGYYTTGKQPTSITTDDLDGDGQMDLVVTNHGANTLTLLFGNGNGSFRLAPTMATQTSPGTVIAMDLTGEGFLDLILSSGDKGIVEIFVANGDGSYKDPVDYVVANQVWGLVIADGDRDGKPDLIASDYSSHLVSVLKGNGDGTFVQLPAFGVGRGPYSVTTADLNKDGWLDLIAANFSSKNLTVFLSAAFGQFETPRIYNTGSYPTCVITGDVDGDNDLDLIVRENYRFEVFLNKGDGTFFAPRATSAGGVGEGIAVGDVNRDGRLDIIVPNTDSIPTGATNNQYLSVYYGKGDGTFPTMAVFDTGGIYPSSVVVGDFNNDANPDIAVTNTGSGTLAILLGNGAGGFGSARIYAAPTQAHGIAAGDTNDDGKLDLVVGSTGTTGVAVFLGTGQGTFQDAIISKVSAGTPGSLAVADINGDEVLDVITANGSSPTVSVFLGNGNGQFQDPLTYYAGAGPVMPAIADFDGDGNLDVASANFYGWNISILAGIGATGTYLPSIRVGRNVLTNSATHEAAIKIGLDLEGNIKILGDHTGTARLEIGRNLKGWLFAHLLGDIRIGMLVPGSNGDMSGIIQSGSGTGNGTIEVGGDLEGLLLPSSSAFSKIIVHHNS